jgi:hypothetical protein
MTIRDFANRIKYSLLTPFDGEGDYYTKARPQFESCERLEK